MLLMIIPKIPDLDKVLQKGNDAGGSVIENLGTPVNDDDATTKTFVEGLLTNVLESTDIGVTVQAHDGDLDTIAGLSPSNDDVLQRKSGAWTNRSMSQLKTDLSLSKSDVGLGNVTNDAQIPTSYLDTDGTLAANSDTKVATQKAVKTYADTLIGANDAMVYKGALDCSTNPNYPAGLIGDTYKVSVAGKIGGGSGPNVQVGDMIICITDSASGDHATVGANWNIIQVNIDGAVIGPASSTDSGIALYDGTSGKLLKNSIKLLPSGDVVGHTDTQTLSGKSISLSSNTITGTVSEFNTALSDGDFATLAGAEALTNKTIDGDLNTIQDVSAGSLKSSATSRIFGRKTAGAGVGEEVTLSELLDFVGSAAQGDILYRGASGWVRLGAGTSGHFLKTNGAGNNPEWATAGGGGGGGDATSFDVAQTGHGFVVGDVIRATSTANTYAKAQADSAANAEVVGYVSVVDDANNFTYTTEGIVSAGVPTNTAGTVYFLSPSSAGALTATEPTTAGQISKPLLTILESATTAYFHNYRGMLLTDPTSAGTVDNGVVEGRLTLTTGTPVMTSTVTAATTVYFTPYKGNYIALYDGSADWDVVQFTEISLSLSGYTANKNYDIWCYNNGGTATLESTVWTDNTTRATALAKQDGVYVKSGATTRRYLGTIRINSSGGQCDFELGGLAVGGAIQSLYVWNYYNRVPVTTYTGDTTDYWIYTGGWRSANNSATYRLDLIVGVQEDIITASYNCYIYTSGTANVGVGYDTTLAFSGSPSGMYAGQYAFAEYRTQPTAGYHYVQAVEAGFSGTSYFYGDDGAPTSNQSILRLSHLC